jgi:autotransporter translocation and assembly factor TamB
VKSVTKSALEREPKNGTSCHNDGPLPRSRLIRVTRNIVIGLVGTIVVAVLGASIVLQGSRLGRLIESTLPENKGKLQIGGVTWRLRALVDIVTDEPTPVSVDGLRITDPEGTVVLDVPHLDCKVKLRTLIARGSFSIHDLRVPVALWRFAALKNSEGIGFTAALAPKVDPPPPPPGFKPKGPGSFFEIAGAEIGDLNAILDFPGSWGLELRNAHARVTLKQDGTDPEHPTFGFDAGPVLAAGGGWLRILDDFVLPFDKVAINRVGTTPEWSDDIFLDLASAETGHSRLVGKGFFTGIYGETSVPGIKLHAAFSQAGDALTAVVAGGGLKIEGLTISGDDASIDANLSDTFAALKVKAAFKGLDAKFDTYRAIGIGFDLGFDAGAGKVDVSDFGFSAPGGGKLRLGAKLDTNTLSLDANLAFTDFHTESYVPPELRAMAGGKLQGRIDARADLAHKSARLPRVDLKFSRPKAGGLPREVRIAGNAMLSADKVKTDGLTVSVTGATATAKGSVNLERQLIDVGLGVMASDLGRLLDEMGLPPIAKSARIDAKADGSFDDPRIAGDANVQGISAGGRKLPELVAKFGLEKGTLRLDRLAGPVLGGRIDGSGTVKLWEKRASKPLRSPIVDVKLDLRDIDLAMLAQSSDLGGRLSLHADANGPLDALTARVTVPAGTPVTVLGDAYALGPVEVLLETDKSGQTATVKTLHLKREGGGTLDVRGKVALAHQDLDLDVVLDKLPLAGLPGVATSDVPVSGFASAKLHIAGRPDRPELTGDVDLAQVMVRGVKLGSGHLALSPTPVGPGRVPGVAIRGRLFDRFDVDAQAALAPKGLLAHAEIDFRRVEIEALAPELGEFGDARGIVSGRVSADIDPTRPLSLDLLLPELWLSVARAVEGSNGETTVQRVRVEAARPLHVSVNGDRVVLDEAHFKTDGGDLVAAGRLDGKAISGNVSGHLDLELLQPFLGAASPIEELHGGLRVELQARGTLDKPDLRGEMTISNPVKLRPKDFDRDVVIGSGKFALDQGGVAVQNLAITVDGSTMRLGGRATLGPGFAPENIQADVEGDVSARLLAFVAPDAVSDAQGKAHVRARVRGTLQKPEIRGRLDLAAIDFRLRDMGTEVQVQSGIVEISNDGVILHNVRVVLDDQGVLVIGASGVRAGRVEFTNLIPFKPGEFDLPLHGEKLTYRSPGTFEVDDLAFDLDMNGNVDDGFELAGEVRLVSGRYLQNFKIKDLMISPRVNESTVRPFYEGKPLLEELALDLSVRTVGEGFIVQNNIAPEIRVDILLHVGGTLSEPQLAGDVRPMDGRFNIPFMRGDFDLVPNVNHVTFIATKSIADGDTPELRLEATNLVTDANGNDHNVRMRISGPLREARIDLSSDDGLDRNQAAMLLITGRTASDSQRVSTQNATMGANAATMSDVGGQITRDAVDNLMQPYIDDTFYRLTGLNLRLTVGSDGFQGRVRKRISRRLNLQADYLQGFYGNSRWTARGDVWVADYITLGGRLEQIRTGAQLGVPETQPMNGVLELRLDYAIRPQ